MFKFKQITNKQELSYKGKVYDLSVQDTHNYNIEDIIVHNSGGGSLVCYALDIIKIDPLQYDLLFERFLNPDRGHIPDIDADFGIYDGYKVFDYLNEKYGKNQCCNIITFMRLKCKSLITDICRTMEVPIPDTKALTKNIDDDMKIEDVLRDKDFRIKLHKYPLLEEMLVKYGSKLENLPRNTGQHAAGICIAPFDVRNITPVVLAKENESKLESNLSSFEKENMESLGIIKYDILKLKTLDVIQQTIDLINKEHDLQLNIDDIPLDDEQTWNALKQGKTLGVFQFEKPIGVKTLQTVKPDNIDELAACNSFIRPGTEGIDAFVAGKNNRQGKIKYGDERIDKILESSHGALVFQEQTMSLIAALMNISFGKADIYRRALEKPKKNEERVKEFEDNCVQRAVENGFSKEVAEKVKKAIIDNSGYSFNKCIAGSEKIYSTNQHLMPTIKEMYDLMHDIDTSRFTVKQKHIGKLYKQRGYGTALSMTDEQNLIVNDIIDITYSGKQDIYLVTTDDNNTVTTTLNHKFPTPNGICTLSQLNVGDKLFVCKKGRKNSKCQISAIKNIKYIGKEDTYNIEMKAPYHNLLMQNGIIVSNSHAVAYSIISYQTAYLKEHYPLEFYATNINTCGENEFFTYLQQAKQLNLEIMQPDVNLSKHKCTVQNNKISIGFNVLKGIGESMANTIIQYQPFKSVQDVLDNTKLNKKCIETLLNSGALSNLRISRDTDIVLNVPRLRKLIELYNINAGKTQNYIVNVNLLPGKLLKQDGLVVENNMIILPENILDEYKIDKNLCTKTSKQAKGKFAAIKNKTSSRSLFDTPTLTLKSIYNKNKEDIDKETETKVEAYLRELTIYNFAFSEHPFAKQDEIVKQYNHDKLLFEEIEENETCSFFGIIIDDITSKTMVSRKTNKPFKIFSFILNTPHENINISMFEHVYNLLSVKPFKGAKCRINCAKKSYGGISINKVDEIMISNKK